ncbi:Aste57867_9857 [Aphanomyces stellatus]|uniref:Aste57867_9857 protein n=1 Tax=Aphanomyces stellatus TaxID=120398 RepID=A0A485KPM0_9STRA|nr:hypothetical protein As57867_009818 [Aphanomyces stellatus]VFT86736.1 Aste57867_9857 [Aphanomyces stellatus]
MKTAERRLAFTSYLDARIPRPLQSSFLGRNYTHVASEKEHMLSKPAKDVVTKAAPPPPTAKPKDKPDVPGIGGVCVNPLNNTLLVCDVQHACVRVLDAATLELQHTIGSKGGNPGKFLEPHCIAISVTGTIAVSDAKVNRIQIFSMQHALLSHFGRFGSDRGHFNQIMGVMFTPDGHIAVADAGNHRVVVVTTTGHILHMVGSAGDAPCQFQAPVALALNRRGDVFVCDRDNHRVQVFATRTMKFCTLWGNGSTMTSPTAIAMAQDADESSDVVVCGATHVFVFTQVGLLSHVLAIADTHGACVYNQQLYLTQSPNILHVCTPYRSIPVGPYLTKVPVVVFDAILACLTYTDAIALRQTSRFFHQTCKALRDAWQLHPFVPGGSATIRYGKVVDSSTGLVAVHDLYSKWGHGDDGLVLDSTFNCAVCAYFGPTFWFQHEAALRVVFGHYADGTRLLRRGFVEVVTVLEEIQAGFLQWHQCPAFLVSCVPPKRFGHAYPRLELLEQTQAYQLDKLVLKLKTMV